MTSTYLSLWLPHLATDRLKRAEGRGGAPSAEGLVTIAKIKGAQRIAAVDREAARLAIRPGMSLADARAVRPGLRARPADPTAEATTLEAIAAWCGRFTPLVALDGADGLVLDIAGAAHLFGGETALMAAAETGLRAQGFEAHAALAASPEAAWALARYGTVKIAPKAEDERAARSVFGPLPVAALRITEETVAALAQAGLRQVDDLLWRPRAPLAARFGAALFDRLDAVMGRLKTPISPRFDPPVFLAEQRFASPILLRDDIERTLLALSGHLCSLLERQGQGARRIEAQLFRVDGAVKRMMVGTSRPLNRPADMARLFREKIESLGEEGLDTAYGFDVVRLAARLAEPCPARQDDLAALARNATEDDLADLVDRLGARLGLRRVNRLMAEATHIPEFAVRAVPASRGFAAHAAKDESPDEILERPLRLFEPPQPIDAIDEVPDGPPRQFNWRRATHVLAAVEGPERIAPEWWRSGRAMLTRDYFRAEDRDGRRYWLFREGLYADQTKPKWFVHGLFG